MAVFFYIFASLLVAGSLLVITSRNPVVAVLWLIFTFCNASGLMILIGAEFIAMMLIIIYVGAVAVLFLFVVMMLNIKFAEFKSTIGPEIGFIIAIALLLLADMVFVILLGTYFEIPNGQFIYNSDIGNTKAIGQLLYTDFILPFQTAGMILFVAMIATISLTMRLRAGVKRQKVSNQMRRNKANSLVMSNKDCKKGVEGLDYGNE